MPHRLYQHLETIWNYHHLGHSPETCDCIFVLGSNDIRVAEQAAALYHQGLAPYVMISGGKGRFTEDAFEKSEAETFAEILIDEGVPASALILEKQATNTGENITLSYALMKEKGHNFQRLLLVQKPFMERRAFATFMKQWPEPVQSVLVTSQAVSLIDYPNEDLPFDMVVDAMIADFERIQSYPSKGFQIEQDIPQAVLDAYALIKELRPSSEWK
ncbi:YdcF family protein [Enterovibrio norvegicus]|uniref:DUF218 domain-containing protein n=1 Tax=Enterovibrio norvegicus TaxID=188144 RepID=A0A2N7L398_9GAMM|nr:YdcF family protein [Enterovibrio norvegicus]PMN74161.1 hypothetical protein BCT27_00860 [Enterovibrio norvegicus]PMN87387.1 hypothetical protein BCT23_08505 [Enterovibrio norvegicus]